MYLSRIIYASRKLNGLAPDELENILHSSEKHNPSQGITGVLCFNRNYFLQLLEGHRDSINHAYTRIASDPRHKDVTLLDYCLIDRREFENWAMAYVPEAGLTAELLLRHGVSTDFNPFEMSPASVLGLLRDLKEIARTISMAAANGKAREEISTKAPL
jgi:hypothetical protein